MTDTWHADGPADDEMSDRWREIVSRTHLPWSTNVAPAPRFAASVRRWWIDDLALVDVECGPTAGTRQRSHIAATDGEFVALLFVRSGQETERAGDAAVRLGPGDAVLWESTAPARFEIPTALSKRSLLIPRGAFEEVGGRTTSAIVDTRAPAVRLLTGYLDTLTAVLPTLDAAATLAARNATLDLVAGLLVGDRERGRGGARDPALRATMERFIERHLGPERLELTPERLAHEHGVSVRTVNRVFSTTGDTVGGVIRSRRLARARHELASGSASIGAIAHRWGFCDASHFTRAFKAAYGMSPRDYREVTASASASCSSPRSPRAR